MRWTRAARLTRAPVLRTAKPCGPDAPTLASSRAEVSARRWWQTSPVTRESAEKTVKTIACGNAGCPGVLVVTNACAFYLCARGCGCSGHPAFPTPFVGRIDCAQLGRFASRGCERVSEISLRVGIANGSRECAPDNRLRVPTNITKRWARRCAPFAHPTNCFSSSRSVQGDPLRATDNSLNSRADIHSPRRYINPARHVRAFGVRIGINT
jgi:hypothetical protein